MMYAYYILRAVYKYEIPYLKGVTRQAIRKYLSVECGLENTYQTKRAIDNLIENGMLIRNSRGGFFLSSTERKLIAEERQRT